jgi:hypothetical protein
MRSIKSPKQKRRNWEKIRGKRKAMSTKKKVKKEVELKKKGRRIIGNKKEEERKKPIEKTKTSVKKPLLR